MNMNVCGKHFISIAVTYGLLGTFDLMVKSFDFFFLKPEKGSDVETLKMINNMISCDA